MGKPASFVFTHPRRPFATLSGFVRLVVLLGAAMLFGASVAGAAPLGAITEFTAGLNPGAHPTGIAAGPDGNLWFADPGTTSAIGRISPSATITEFSSGLNAGSRPGGSLANNANNGDRDRPGRQPLVHRPDTRGRSAGSPPAGRSPSSQAASTRAAPRGIDARGPTATSGSPIRARPRSAGSPRAGRSRSFNLLRRAHPIGIAAGPDGNLWFSDRAAARDRPHHHGRDDHRVPPARGPARRARSQRVRTATSGSLTAPRASDRADHAERDHHRVHERPEPGQPPVLDRGGPDSNLWFTDPGTAGVAGTIPAIGRVDPATGAITEFSSGLPAGSGPFGVTAGPDGNLWFSESLGTVRAIGQFGLGVCHDDTLVGCNLKNVNLQNIILNGANLSGGNLLRAQLQNARLIGANLQGDNLNGAQLQNAFLDGANLEVRTCTAPISLTLTCPGPT